MIARRTFGLLVAALLAAALVTGTGGVSTVSMDRGVQASIADDHVAYLGFDQSTTTDANGTTNLTVTVTDRLPSGQVLSRIDVTVGGTTVDLAADGPLGPGENATHTFTGVTCGDPIVVDADADTVHVHLERTVDCS